MGRVILLPRKFAGQLMRLTKESEEINGFLFYRLQGNYCPIEHLYITGVGTEGQVKDDSSRVQVINQFFQQNPNHRIVKWHTHSQGTIDQYGDFYANNFSGEDIKFYDRHLEFDSEFIGMVVTPKKMLLYAPDNPIIQTVDDFPYQASRRIKSELEIIARNG